MTFGAPNDHKQRTDLSVTRLAYATRAPTESRSCCGRYAPWSGVARLVVTLFATASGATFSADWSERVDFYLQQYEASAESPKPIVYPRLSERIRSLFFQDGPSHITIESDIDGDRELLAELFFTDGELLVIQHREGWNLITKGEYVLEWEVGATSGFRIQKDEGDLVDYILYLTDPSYIMTSMYYQCFSEPSSVEITDEPGMPWREFTFKDPQYGFESVLVDAESLWFHGFRVRNPDSGAKTSMYVSRPMKSRWPQERLNSLIEDIEFSDSERTLRRHMVYL